jgi:hypothetical protein
LILDDQAGLSVNSGVLAPDTVYYWKVVPANVTGDATGVIVWNFTTSNPPTQASSPSPADGATKVVPYPLTLTWTAGTGAVSHKIYFGTTAILTEENLLPSQIGMSLAVTRLAFDTLYYWRVDEVDADGLLATGSVLSFTTRPSHKILLKP